MIASIIDKKPKLSRIVDGRIDEDIKQFWIENAEGFDFYQESFHGLGLDIPLKNIIIANL